MASRRALHKSLMWSPTLSFSSTFRPVLQNTLVSRPRSVYRCNVLAYHWKMALGTNVTTGMSIVEIF
jgi:hypothetical protein